MSNLTPNQLIALRVVVSSGGGVNRDEILARWQSERWDGAPSAGSAEGLGQTMGSLVKRGLVSRDRVDGRVVWSPTEKGRAAARSY